MRQYLDLLVDIRDNGAQKGDRTGTGTKSLFGRQLRFDLSEGFPLVTTKKLAFRWIAEELFWMLSGSTDVKELQEKGITIWDSWATEEQCAKFGRPPGQLGPGYGHLFRNYGATPVKCPITGVESTWEYNQDGEDQIATIVDQLVNSPDSRRIILNGWDPREATQVALPPCHTLTQFYVVNGKLSCHMYQRSADTLLGIPFNIASYALLTHMLANVVGLEVGDFIHSFGDVHIYYNHMEQVEEQLAREPRALPKLSFRRKGYPSKWTPLVQLLNIEYRDLVLDGYDPHPSIKAPVAV